MKALPLPVSRDRKIIQRLEPKRLQDSLPCPLRKKYVVLLKNVIVNLMFKQGEIRVFQDNGEFGKICNTRPNG